MQCQNITVIHSQKSICIFSRGLSFCTQWGKSAFEQQKFTKIHEYVCIEPKHLFLRDKTGYTQFYFFFYLTEVPLLSKWEGILTGFIHQNPCKETAYSMLHPTLVVIWTSFVLPPWTVEGQAFLRHSSHSLLLIRIGFWSETLCEVFKFYDLSTFVKISNFSPLSLSSFI